MKTTITNEEKIHYLYNMLPKGQRLAFESELNRNEELADEMLELRKTMTLLSEMEQVKAPSIDVRSLLQRNTSKWQKITYTTMKYAAVALILFMVVGFATNLNVQYDNDGLNISMSFFPVEPTVIPSTTDINEQTIALLREFQEQQTTLFAEILAQERAEQQNQIKELLIDHASMIENRRMIDLQLIQYELENMQERNDSRLYRTDRVLYQLLETLSYNN
jgi:hypothetical protein